MYVTHEITIDLLRPETNVIHVVQDDSTRKILLTLLSGGMPYSVGSDLSGGESYTGVVSFRKADGHGGTYDTANMVFSEATLQSGANPKALGLYELDGVTYVLTEDTTVVQGKTYYEGDGDPAVSLVTGTVNKFECFLDGQCFTCPGWAQINIQFYTEAGKLLHTFAIHADVQESATNSTQSADVFVINSISGLIAAITRCLMVVNQNWSENEKAIARANIDAAAAGDVPTDAVTYSAQPNKTTEQKTQARQNIGAGTYSKPSSGIPASDLAAGIIPSASSATPSSLGTESAGSSTDYSRADHVHKLPSASDVGAYEKPSGGIPKTDLAESVQTSLEKADSATGWSSTAIQLLNTILSAGVYTSNQSANIAALIDELTASDIDISYIGTTATIIGLAGTNITYSGTTATIGGA